jgi:DNA-binding transcriptional LysR family regulator
VDERDWLIIKTLDKYKSITKAANVLYLSQPALTSRIKQIESSLNTKLLYRGNKGITFTPTGKKAVVFAEHILDEMHDFREEISDMNGDVSGVLRLTAPAIISAYYLPRLLSKFKEEYPNVRFEVTVADSTEIVNTMNSKSFHFGFLRNDFGWDESEKILLATNYIVAVSMQPFKLEDLPKMVRVEYETDSYYKLLLDTWWNENFRERPNIGMQVATIGLGKEMIFGGMGYGILPSIFLPEAPGCYNIPLCDKDGKKIIRKTWLIYKKESLDIKLAKTFFDFIQSHDFESFLKPQNQLEQE